MSAKKINISAPTNKGKVQIPYPTKIKTILNELAMLVYGKRIDECWGKPQNVLVSKLKGVTITVTLPEKEELTLNKRDQRDLEENEKAIQNVVSHAQEKGVTISVV